MTGEGVKGGGVCVCVWRGGGGAGGGGGEHSLEQNWHARLLTKEPWVCGSGRWGGGGGSNSYTGSNGLEVRVQITG